MTGDPPSKALPDEEFPPPTPPPYCIFCFKENNSKELMSSSGVSRQNNKNINNKLLAIERYLGIQLATWQLKFCPDCDLLLDKFAELYGALRRIELELEWRLGMMRDILVAASRVPSRVAFVRGYYYSEMGKEESVMMMMSQVEEWRRKLVRNCELKLMGSSPKVKLCKLEGRRDGTGDIQAVPLNSDADAASVTFRMNRRWASSSSPKKGLARPVQSSGPVLQKLLKEEVDVGWELGTKGDGIICATANDWMDKCNANVKDPFIEISNEFPQNPSIKQELADESDEEEEDAGESSANICESVVVGPEESYFISSTESPRPPVHSGSPPKGLKNINGRRFKCPICKSIFTQRRSLHRHRRTHHHVENNGVLTTVFKCNKDDEDKGKKCAAFFILRSQLKRHQEHAHNPGTSNNTVLGVTWRQPQGRLQQFGRSHHHRQSNKVQYYQCRVCKASFPRVFNLRRHYQVQHGVRCKDTLRCDVLGCSAYFRTPNQLVLHKKRAHQKASCMTSGRVRGKLLLIPGQDLLKSPTTNTVNNVVIYKCVEDQCTASFTTKVGWKRHLRQKHGKGLPCTLCGKEYSAHNNLRQHRYNMHRNELDLKFGCKVAGCKRKFETEGELQRHNDLSHKERQKSYANGFQCSVCNKKCPSKYQLDRHLRTHTGDKPFICQYCGMVFSRKDALKRHKTNMHPEVVERRGFDK